MREAYRQLGAAASVASEQRRDDIIRVAERADSVGCFPLNAG